MLRFFAIFCFITPCFCANQEKKYELTKNEKKCFEEKIVGQGGNGYIAKEKGTDTVYKSCKKQDDNCDILADFERSNAIVKKINENKNKLNQVNDTDDMMKYGIVEYQSINTLDASWYSSTCEMKKIDDYTKLKSRKYYLKMAYIQKSLLDWANETTSFFRFWNGMLNITKKIYTIIGNLKELGIVHRDVKPDNIMIETDDKNNFNVYLIDMDCAQFSLVKIENRCGTPFYMHQNAFGTNESGMGNVDVWSLAMLLLKLTSPRLDAPSCTQSLNNHETALDDAWKKKLNLQDRDLTPIYERFKETRQKSCSENKFYEVIEKMFEGKAIFPEDWEDVEDKIKTGF